MIKETQQEYFRRMMIQLARIDKQHALLNSALLKLKMLGLTPEMGVVQLEVPEGISPGRWKAMVTHAYYQGIPVKWTIQKTNMGEWRNR